MPAVDALHVGADPLCKTLPTTSVSGVHTPLAQV